MAHFSPLKNRHSTAGRGQLSNEPKKRLFLHDYKVHRKTNPDTLDETLPKLRAHWHSHPDNLKASTKDYEASEILRSKFGDPYSPCGYIPTYIYSRGKHILYNNCDKTLDENTENALRDEAIIP